MPSKGESIVERSGDGQSVSRPRAVGVLTDEQRAAEEIRRAELLQTLFAQGSWYGLSGWQGGAPRVAGLSHGPDASFRQIRLLYESTAPRGRVVIATVVWERMSAVVAEFRGMSARLEVEAISTPEETKPARVDGHPVTLQLWRREESIVALGRVADRATVGRFEGDVSVDDLEFAPVADLRDVGHE
jgi:hypothetical protein